MISFTKCQLWQQKNLCSPAWKHCTTALTQKIKFKIIAFNSRLFFPYQVFESILYQKKRYSSKLFSVDVSLLYKARSHRSRRHLDNFSQRLIKWLFFKIWQTPRSLFERLFILWNSSLNLSKVILSFILLPFTLKAPSVHGYNTHSEYVKIV